MVSVLVGSKRVDYSKRYTINGINYRDLASVEQEVRKQIENGTKEVSVYCGDKLERVYYRKGKDVLYVKNNYKE